MSHTVKVQTEVKDAIAAEAACRRIGIPPPTSGTHRLFSGRFNGLAVRLPGWHYPIVCDLSSGQINYDNYDGRWGEQQHLGSFLRAYGAEKTRIEARKKGYGVVEHALPGGYIAVDVQIGGAA